MPFEVWFAFLLAAAVVIAIPGPTNLVVVAYTLRRGRRAGLTTVLGVLPGIATAMMLSFAGLGALLAASAEVFTAVKWAGAAYLIYLGVRQWRAAAAPAELPGPNDGPGADDRNAQGRMLRDAFLVTLLNPKGIIFFSAFFPQFLDPGRPVLPQMALLGATFLLLVLPINSAYAVMAGALRSRLAEAAWRRLLNRIGGALLIGAGLFTLTLRRS